jgi:hypothetical protein
MRGARRESVRRNDCRGFRESAPTSRLHLTLKPFPCRAPPSPRPSPSEEDGEGVPALCPPIFFRRYDARFLRQYDDARAPDDVVQVPSGRTV